MRKLYIDFDNTLFDTQRFINDCLNIFDKYYISDNKKKEIIKNLNIKNIIRDFKTILKDFSLKLNIDYDSLLNDYNNILNNNYLFHDSLNFLKKIKKKYEIILLTYGNNDYQLDKIKSSGISEFFNQIIITQYSKDNLNIDYENSIFIDDFPDILIKLMNKNCYKVIRLKRGKYKDIKLEKIDTFDDFESIYNYLIEIEGDNE